MGTGLIVDSSRRLRVCGAALLLFLLGGAGAALGQAELTYEQYRELAWAADRLNHMAIFEPLHGETGMYYALGERFGTVQVVKIDGRGGDRVWKSVQLNGVPVEVIATDLSGDSLDDALVCRTDAGQVYVWTLEDYTLVWESLPSEYRHISCFTTANMDDDPATEIVMLADRKIVFIDGAGFNKDFTGISDFDATMIRCGDVDGDGRQEIVLNSGQVLDSVSGEIEWEDETFFHNIELLDIDADGIPEVLTESVDGGPLKVFDVDYKSEVRFQ